jgi:hypothetical protein
MTRRAMPTVLVLVIAAGLLLTACGSGPSPSGDVVAERRVGARGTAAISSILASSSLVCCAAVLALALGAVGLWYVIRRPPSEG